MFTRWFQFGAFCPIFRIHGKGERALFSDNWDKDTKQILLNFDKLRYRLLPYIYSLAGKINTENYTMMRSLAFDFRKDKNVYSIPDQYMFGPAFMVCPVTDQLYTGEGATNGPKTRKVYLPAFTTWYNFWTGETIKGGQTINAEAPINILPLYVKAGSIVPMGPVVEYATQKTKEPTELRIYPGADGQFKFYEDENDNYNYEKGSSATFLMSWNNKSKLLTIGDIKGQFSGMVKQHTFKIVLVKPGHGIDNQLTTNVDKLITYTGRTMVVKI